MNLSIKKFDEFLKLIFPELNYGGLLRGDKFKTVRMFAISNVNIMQLGLFLTGVFYLNLHFTAYFTEKVY